MSSIVHQDDTPIVDVSQLIDYLAAGAKPEKQWRIGTEHEKFGWWTDRLCPPTYDGARGIRAVLDGFAALEHWTPNYENGVLLSLSSNGASITLEPSGQLELSGRPLRSLLDTAREFDDHLAELDKISAPLAIAWSGVGFTPWGTPEQMPRMPKPRYAVLEKRLQGAGRYGIHMMRQTATVQANFDFASEVDAFRKLRAALYVQPIVTAIFANSPVVDGQLVPESSFRANVWLDTDNERCQLGHTFLEDGATFEDYVAWAIDVPMLFIHRNNEYLDFRSHSFRRFMDRGVDGHVANIGDFALHLSTLFPDVRLKQFIEVRAADMGSRDYVLALPALHAGLLYDEQALDETLSLLSPMGPRVWDAIKSEVPVGGLNTVRDGFHVGELAEQIIGIAESGLQRWQPESTHLLRPLREAVSRGACPADTIRSGYSGDPNSVLKNTRLV